MNEKYRLSISLSSKQSEPSSRFDKILQALLVLHKSNQKIVVDYEQPSVDVVEL